MSEMAALERRYRRMLIWFPSDHRRVYGEEMVGVLLASAPDGRSRPGLADTIDIALAGLRTRLRSSFRAERIDSEWCDAFAGFSVAAPFLMLAYVCYQLYIVLRAQERLSVLSRLTRLAPFDQHFVSRLAGAQVSWLLLLAATVAVIAALAICPVLLRRRQRFAIALIAIGTVLLGAAATIYVAVAHGFGNEVSVGFTAFFAMEIIAVLIAPVPGRGWRVLTRKGLVIIVAVGALAIGTEAFLQNTGFNRFAIKLSIALVGVALILVFGSRAHKRMLALLAIPGYPILGYVQAYSVLSNGASQGSVLTGLYLPTLVIAVLVGLSIWQSSRREVSAAG